MPWIFPFYVTSWHLNFASICRLPSIVWCRERIQAIMPLPVPKDRNTFISHLVKYTCLFDFRVHARCVLTNHFHLLFAVATRIDPLIRGLERQRGHFHIRPPQPPEPRDPGGFFTCREQGKIGRIRPMGRMWNVGLGRTWGLRAEATIGFVKPWTRIWNVLPGDAFKKSKDSAEKGDQNPLYNFIL